MRRQLQGTSINIDSLTVGMVVMSCDLHWLDNPYFGRNKHITSQAEIDLLRRAGAKKLVVLKNPKPINKEHKSTKLKTTSIEKELLVANELKYKITEALNQTFKQLENQELSQSAINSLKPLIPETIESLVRQNQALLTIIHQENKDSRLADHAFSVMCLSLIVALNLNLNKTELENIALAALLHDCAWSYLPLHLMGKRNRYNAQELQLVTTHVKDIDKKIKGGLLNPETFRLIQEHHERLDGSGYPYQKKGNALHPLSQLIAIADYYDELHHQLLDQPSMTSTAALKKIFHLAEEGLFNRDFVQRLIESIGIFPVMSIVRLSSGALAQVIEVNTESPLLPIVKLYVGDEITSPPQGDTINLSDHDNSVMIVEALKA